MADILAIRDAIADAIVAGSDLRAYKGARSTVEVPCAVVPLPEIDYLEDIDGYCRMTFQVRILVGGKAENEAQEHLAAYMSTAPTGLPAVIQSDTALLAVADTVAVLNAARVGSYSYGEGTSYIGFELTVVTVA